MTVVMTKIYIGNIPESCKVEELKTLFQKFGRVEECDIVKNFGFVHMSSDDETKLAIDSLNGTEFKGTKISVEASHSKVRPKPGMGGKGQCYRCGKSGHWSKECPRNYDRGRGSLGKTYNYCDRFNRFGPIRSHSTDRYDRVPYVRPYVEPYDRRPYADPYQSRPLPPHDYYRRPLTPPFDEYLCDRRIHDRYNHYFDDRPYSYYSSHSSRREAIY